MKKFYLLIAMLLVASISFSQPFIAGPATSKKVAINHDYVKTATDTTGWSLNFFPEFALGGQVWTYTYTGGGYCFGIGKVTPTAAFNKIAQGYTYIPTGLIGIEGVTFFCCGLTYASGLPTSKLTFSIYNKPDSIPTTQVGTVSADLLMSAVDSTFLAWNTVTFPSTIPVSADFAIYVNLANVSFANGDTIGLSCDTDGEGCGWASFRYGTTWYTYFRGFAGLNPNIALFAIVDVNYVGIDGNVFFQGSKMSFQNPAKDNLTVNYAVEKDAKVKFELLTMNGQPVVSIDEGNKVTGNVYTINADISNVAAGTYLANLICNGQRLIKKVVIE
jgi:hypothetical protein